MPHETRSFVPRGGERGVAAPFAAAIPTLCIDLAGVPVDASPWVELCERTMQALGAAVVGVSQFDPARSELEVRFVCIRGRQLFVRLNRVLGERFRGLRMKVAPEQVRQILSEGARRSEDVTEMAFGTVSRAVVPIFRHALGLGSLYGLALRQADTLLGTALVIMPQGAPELPREPLLLLSHAASTLVWRHEAARALRESEQRAARAAQSEALGALARGVAHDFNNLLSALLGFARLAQRDAPEGSAQHHRLARIEALAQRAAGLTRGLLDAAPRDEGRLERTDLTALAGELAPLLESGLRAPGCEVRFELAEQLPPVLADPLQLGRAAMNLAVNALQAMEGRKGRLVVSTGVERLEREALSRMAVAPESPGGTFAWLSVTDDGCGIDRGTLARIFEPGFTTKPDGTGYGLVIAREIVVRHGGGLDVRSTPGAGTTVRLLLPALAEGLAGQEAPEVRGARRRRPGGAPPPSASAGTDPPSAPRRPRASARSSCRRPSSPGR